MTERKFTFQEIISDAPEVIQHDLQKQINMKPKKTKGGNQERNYLLRAILQAHELTLKRLNEIDSKLDRVIKE